MLKQLEMHLEALIDGKWHHVSCTRITDYHLFAFLNGEDIEHLRNNEDIEPVCPKSITLNLDETSDTTRLLIGHQTLTGNAGVMLKKDVDELHKRMLTWGQNHFCEEFMKQKFLYNLLPMLKRAYQDDPVETIFGHHAIARPDAYMVIWRYTE